MSNSDHLTKLLVSLGKLLIEIQKQQKTVSENQQAQDNQAENPIPLKPIEFRSDASLIVTIREYYEAEQRERQSLWKRIKPGLEIVGVGVAIVIAVFNLATFSQIRKQTQFTESTVRPWLKIFDVRLDSFSEKEPSVLSFEAIQNLRMATLRTEITVTNAGHSMANKVLIQPEIVFHKYAETIDTLPSSLDRICNHWQKEAPWFPNPGAFTYSAVFPGEQPVKSKIIVSGIYQSIDINHIPGRPGEYLSVDLVVCVNYQSPELYQTRAVFHVMGDVGHYFEIGKDLDSSHVHLLRDEHYEHAQ